MKEILDFKDKVIQKLIEENQELREQNIRYAKINKKLAQINVEIKTVKSDEDE